jgi:hypothetical protein
VVEGMVRRRRRRRRRRREEEAAAGQGRRSQENAPRVVNFKTEFLHEGQPFFESFHLQSVTIYLFVFIMLQFATV